MKHFNSRGTRSRLLGLMSLSATALFGVMSCTPDFDLDKRTPEWLGSSIYETLKEGFKNDDENDKELYGKEYSFQYYARLIEDLDQVKILAKTGSKTLFVADDKAFERFFDKGVFKTSSGNPVSCYDSLSYAQKSMILKGSMLNNVYQVAMLSSSQGPVLGDCMRRVSSISVYDTVSYLKTDNMPPTAYWRYYKENGKNIAIMQDGTTRPLVFFVNKFLTMKKIMDDDYDFLFNQGQYGTAPARKPGEASVNGVRIEYQNKKCFNGFLHVMSEVIYSLPNMAEYLETAENTRIYSSIVDRFCAPYYSKEHTDQVQRLIKEEKISFPTTIDSVFQKQYFSQRTQGNRSLSQAPNRSVIAKGELLKFDPGWNTFYSQTSANTTADVALQQNMAVMLVPKDDVLTDWWQNGGGKALRERYGHVSEADLAIKDSVIVDIAGVPRGVIVKLLNNNMLNSLVGSVPSKFANVLDDANDPMGIETSNVDSVAMCCNGAIYLTNSVFSPTAYRSVSYPALVNENLQIINWAIDEYDFPDYLNSMVATYSFFVPIVRASTDAKLDGRMVYIDPVSFNTTTTNAIVFNYNETTKTVEARSFPYDVKNDSVITTGAGASVTTSQIENRLKDMLDYHIVIGDVEDGHMYYQTKGRGTIKFDKSVGTFGQVSGGYQLETVINDTVPEQKINILNRYDLSKGGPSNGNGRTYMIDRPMQTSRNSVYDILSDSIHYPEFTEFFKLMQGAVSNKVVNGKQVQVRLFTPDQNNHSIGSAFNVSTMNTYHYTIYVPTNASLLALMAGPNPKLYSPKMIGDIEEEFLDYDDEVRDGTMTQEQYDSKLDEIWTKYKTMAGVPADSVRPATFVTSTYTSFLSNRLADFVKYHIQDNSVYIGAEFNVDIRENPSGEANYETAFMNAKQQFVKLAVKPVTDGGAMKIQVRDANNNLRSASDQNMSAPVDGSSPRPLYNIMCREYEYNDKDLTKATNIETSSWVVIHQIDGPLCNGVEIF